MGDKSAPEITIKLEPITLTGVGLGLLGLAMGWVLWGLHSFAGITTVHFGDDRSTPAAAPPLPDSSLPLDPATIPHPEDFSRSLQGPLPEDSVWVEAVRATVNPTPDPLDLDAFDANSSGAPGSELSPSGSSDFNASDPSAPESATSSPTTSIANVGSPGLLAAPVYPPNAIGFLRVGNHTEHPIRLALLQRAPTAPNPTPLPPLVSPEPFHWDFAPGEGWVQGLILSLPEGDLSLIPGDVLVAFAQDGSHRYWGPFVVGETDLPYWHPEQQEWQLLIQSSFP